MQAKRTFKLVGVLALLVRRNGVTCFPPFFRTSEREDAGRLPKSAAMDVATAYWQASPADLPFLLQRTLQVFHLHAQLVPPHNFSKVLRVHRAILQGFQIALPQLHNMFCR